MVRIFSYKQCGTCRKATLWLTRAGIEFEQTDITTTPPTREELALALKKSGLPVAKFFNTSGQSYRAGDFKSRLPTMSEADALTALAADGRLIKRPLVFSGDIVLVGFDEALYAAALGR